MYLETQTYSQRLESRLIGEHFKPENRFSVQKMSQMWKTVQCLCIIFTFSDLNRWPSACPWSILLRWICLPENKVEFGAFTTSLLKLLVVYVVYRVVLTMVMLLSWTAGFPGGRTNTLTLQLMATLAPEVLIEERGGDVTSNSSDRGCSIRAGFWLDREQVDAGTLLCDLYIYSTS